MYHKHKGFTLVELIVVITILAILATIGYVSYLGYASFARDSTRLNNISVITRAMEYYKLKNTILPTPDNAIPITISGSVVGQQGDAGTGVLAAIAITEGGTDPLDGEYYSYFLSGNKAQVLALLENERGEHTTYTPLDRSYASVDYSDRYPKFKGDALGLLLEDNFTPIHRSADVVLASEFDILSAGFATRKVRMMYDNEIYPSTPVVMIGGQLSLNLKRSRGKECPTNYIPVPENKELGQPAFCIGQYEASTTTGMSNEAFNTLPGEMPLVNLSNGLYDCRANGPNYHIMTMMEWLTIARNIEAQDVNWSGGVTGSGHIKGGNNGNSTTGFVSAILATGSSGNATQDALRQLQLSNGEIIWDFVGNVWEVVKGLNLYTIPSGGENEVSQVSYTGITPVKTALSLISIEGISSTNTFYSWDEISDEDFVQMYGPRIGTTSEQGIGKVKQAHSYVYTVGGDNQEEASTPNSYENGLYSMIKASSMNYSNVGTRCAYNY